MKRRVLAIIRKEFLHIVRDWQTLYIVLALPVVMMFLFGYALDVNIRDVSVMIEDPSLSPQTRELTREIDNSALFKVAGVVTSSANPQELFRDHRIKALFRFSKDFSKNLHTPLTPASVQVVIDGSDQNIATIIRNAVEPFLQKATLSMLHQPLPAAITVQQTVLYNPRQKSALYFVPGLMAMILMMISALLTSLAITREKELSTMQQLLVTPLSPPEIMIGKLTPYICLAAVDGMLILFVGIVLFGVRIAGSSLVLAMASLIYITVALSLGLLISTLVNKQVHALLTVMPTTMLPTMLLSGFIFPLESLPVWLKPVSAVVPATYFLRVIRGIILKGVGVVELWQPLAVLCVMAVLLMTISIKKFKVRP
jgi:ABC-2 type transport system permease protein